jgi:hypothetical protein
MERKGCKRFATTTEAEIEGTRLKLNAERTMKQNKAAAAILKDYLFQKKMDIEFEEFKVLCFLF